MKSTILLRIASIVLLLHLAGHLFGHFTWKQSDDPVQAEVIRHMTQFEFPFMGALHSMGDYYDGYGWASSISLLFFAILFWILSYASAGEKALSRKIVLILSICLLGWGVMELVFFFPFAAGMTFLSALLGVVAYSKLTRQV